MGGIELFALQSSIVFSSPNFLSHKSTIHLGCDSFIEISTGSLGQGLSIGVGASISNKLDQIPSNTYILLGDGECQEGQVWEAIMLAGEYKLDNLIAIVDYNKGQLMDNVKDIINLEPFKDKWEKFGWHAQTINGHDINELLNSYKIAKSKANKPSVIIANTLKGKGISFMEEEGYKWHGKKPNIEEYKLALKELE